MSARRHDPLRLDVAGLTADGETLPGEWPLASLERLCEMQTAPQDWLMPPVAWRVRGERRPVSGEQPQTWLHIRAQATIWLTCQRCLQPYRTELVVDRAIRFVRGEDLAEALDAESEEDVLALPRELDLRALVEDELLLALPIVPRHETCPDTPPALAASTPALAQAQHPFEILKALKTGAADG
jgi:uncharacterized protein